MSTWRRIDINLQTGKTLLHHPLLPLVIHTISKMSVQVSQCPRAQGQMPTVLSPCWKSSKGFCKEENALLSVCNALWSTCLRKHQFCSPEGVLLHRSYSPLVSLLPKTGVKDVATLMGENLLLLPAEFLTRPTAGWLLPPCSPSNSMGICAEHVLPICSPHSPSSSGQEMGAI